MKERNRFHKSEIACIDRRLDLALRDQAFGSRRVGGSANKEKRSSGLVPHPCKKLTPMCLGPFSVGVQGAHAENNPWSCVGSEPFANCCSRALRNVQRRFGRR